MAVKKKVVEIDTQQATTSVKELRQQLKQLKDTMLSTEQGTEEYNAALRQSADIMHTLKEQSEELNASAADFGQICGNVVKATGGMVAGLQAARATMNLFGIENENIIKSLQQMQNLMAITQALPSIEGGIKAFKRLSLVIKSATGATHGFKAALVSTGIGAAVVAIGLLVANFDKLKAAITGTNEELEKQKKLDMENHLKKVNEQLEKQLDLEERIRKAAGQNDLEVAEARVKSIEKEIKRKEQLIQLNRRNEIAAIDELNRNIQAGKDQSVINALREKANKIHEKEETLQREINNLRDGALKTAKEEFEVEKKLAAARKIKEDADKAEKEAEDRRKRALDDLKKLRESYVKLTEEIQNYNKSQKELDIQKLDKEEAEKIKIATKAEKNTIIREQKITAIREHYAAERAKIEKKYADEEIKTRQESSFAELALLENNYKMQEAALKASLDDQEIDLIQFNERKKELDEAYKEDYVSTLKALLEDETLNTEQRLELYQKLNEFRNPESKDEKKEDEKSLTDGITEAINASALALNDFSDNPAWGNILRNIATLTANWDTLNVQIQKGGKEAFTAYAQIAATALSAVAQMLNGLAAEQDASNEKGFESQKNLQAAGATMSMLAGIVSAWASAMQLGPIAGPIMGAILSAMMLATGIAQIVKIKQQKFDSKSTPGTGTPSSGAVSAINAPVQYTQDVQGANIEGSIKDQRVYVTEGDITNTQERVSVTESEAKY